MRALAKFFDMMNRGNIYIATAGFTFVLILSAQVLVAFMVYFFSHRLGWYYGPDFSRNYLAPLVVALATGIISYPAVYSAFMVLRRLRVQNHEIKVSRKFASELNDQRARFLAYVSHEIRNPLNGVVGLADSIDTSKIDIQTAEKIGLIKSNSQELLMILNDILDLSKIDQDGLKINAKLISLHRELNELLEFWRPQAKEAGLILELKLATNCPDHVEIDGFRFRQIVNNLISNAISYTDQGQVSIIAIANPERSTVKVQIIDTGRGIPEEFQDEIFQPYAQVVSETRKSTGGTGLGLPIAKKLANMMGGDIQLIASSSRGTKFEFVLPVTRIQSDVSTPTERVDFGENKKALVADDSAASAIVARELLKQMGFDVCVVSSGQSLIETLQSDQFELMFVDNDLGDETIDSLLKKYTKLPNVEKIIAYTGRCDDLTRERFLDLGFDGFLCKPINFNDVYDEVSPMFPVSN